MDAHQAVDFVGDAAFGGLFELRIADIAEKQQRSHNERHQECDKFRA